MVESSLSTLLISYVVLMLLSMIVGGFINAFLQPLAQWCSVKVWQKIFAYLNARRAPKKVEPIKDALK